MNEKELVNRANKHIIRSVREDWAPPILASGKGSLVKDVNDREFIDFTSDQICAAVGHNHPKVIEAIEGACRDILHANTWRQSVDTLVLPYVIPKFIPSVTYFEVLVHNPKRLWQEIAGCGHLRPGGLV